MARTPADTDWIVRKMPGRHLDDARPGFVPVAGRYVVVGCADSIPAVARILSVDHEGHIELEVLPGDVESHRDLLTPACLDGLELPIQLPIHVTRLGGAGSDRM